jgi:hypothetical protein
MNAVMFSLSIRYDGFARRFSMTDVVMSKAQLMTKFERAWNALQSTLDEANDADLTSKTDAAGWSGKDHLAHLADWANSVLVMVRDGRPQWEGLGIDKELFDTGGYDEQNEVIRQQSVDLPLKKVRSQLTDVHKEIVRILEGMSDSDLMRPCSDFVAGGQDVEIVHKLNGNGPDHYDEHRAYIAKILKG